MNFHKSLLLSSVLFLSFTSSASEVCNLNSSDEYQLGALSTSQQFSCQGEPDYYAITIYEMGLCPSTITAPTISTPIDLSACQVAYTNTSGLLIQVENGSSSPMTGGVTSRPDPGTYNYGYIKLSNIFKIKAAITFDGSAAGEPDGSAPTTANGTGVYCYTSGNTSSGTHDYSSDSSYLSSTTCSTSASDLTNAQINDSPLTSFGSGSFSASGTSGVVTAYLVDSSNQLSSGTGDISGLIGIQDFSSTPIVITESTTTMDAQFTVTQGMSVSQGGSSAYIGLGNGPFQVSMTVN